MPRADVDAAFFPEYVREPDVSTELDGERRELISGAVNQPHNAFPQIRRYAQEMPRHRYSCRSREGRLIAHPLRARAWPGPIDLRGPLF